MWIVNVVATDSDKGFALTAQDAPGEDSDYCHFWRSDVPFAVRPTPERSEEIRKELASRVAQTMAILGR